MLIKLQNSLDVVLGSSTKPKPIINLHLCKFLVFLVLLSCLIIPISSKTCLSMVISGDLGSKYLRFTFFSVRLLIGYLMLFIYSKAFLFFFSQKPYKLDHLLFFFFFFLWTIYCFVFFISMLNKWMTWHDGGYHNLETNSLSKVAAQLTLSNLVI